MTRKHGKNLVEIKKLINENRKRWGNMQIELITDEVSKVIM